MVRYNYKERTVKHHESSYHANGPVMMKLECKQGSDIVQTYNTAMTASFPIPGKLSSRPRSASTRVENISSK